MTPQDPAQGILKISDYGDSIFYYVPCSCGNPDDSITFEVEADKTIGEVMVNTYTTQKTLWWKKPFDENSAFNIDNAVLSSIIYNTKSFLNSLTHRLKVTYTIWTKGYVEYSHTTIMNKQQALSYAHTIINAIEQVEKHERKIEP